MSLLAKVLIGMVKLYQWTLSPYLGQQCRFSPTCSQYAIEALQKHGAVLGFAYAVRRIGKCHPWHPGGHDAVP